MPLKNVKQEVVEKLIASTILSTLSYIKPGAPHRYSTHKWVIDYSMIGALLLDPLIEACVKGEMVGRGDISAREIGLSRIILESYNTLLRKYGVLPQFPHTIPIFPILAVSSSHAIVSRGKIEVSTLRSSITTILTSCRGEELSNLVRRLYRLGDSRIEETLRAHNISEALVSTGSLTLLDVLEALSSIEDSYKELISPKIITKASKRIVNTYSKYRSLNTAVIAGYLEILRINERTPKWVKNEVEEVLKESNIGTREGMRKLYLLDKRFRDENLDFTHTLPTLNLATYLSLWEGIL